MPNLQKRKTTQKEKASPSKKIPNSKKKIRICLINILLPIFIPQ